MLQAVQVTPAHHQKKTTDQTDNQTIVNDSWEKILLPLIRNSHQRMPKGSSAPKTKYKRWNIFWPRRGSNRIGTVYVSVNIKNDRIDTVEITEADTHYSQKVTLSGLPSQVVQRQSSDVDVVSGAAPWYRRFSKCRG